MLAIFPLSILAGIPAIVFGARALSDINASSGALEGRVIAWSGILLGCISVVAFIVVVFRIYV